MNDIFCEFCRERVFGGKDGYKLHLGRWHTKAGVKVWQSTDLSLKSSARALESHPSGAVQVKIMPERTTTRTKGQIVHDVEKMLGYAIIPMVKPWSAWGDK